MQRLAQSLGRLSLQGKFAVGRGDALSKNLPAAGSFATGAADQTPQDSIEVFVNGVGTQVAKGSTVLQACDAAGVDIPRFCYHQRLSIAGNCRMCLVEVEKSPKPVASCAMPAGPGMKIFTDTMIVKKAREGVMEFLLINHPLDCPICDQGGECDLQDQSMVFGSDRGRFTEMKRSVQDKNLGPLVKTVMTRCIHCTRCVRFAQEVAGVEDLGMTGRGNASEIGTYVDKAMQSELSGNVIDLCPVGALTSKPYAFTARNWELRPTESIDVSDALGANIRIDARGSEVMRVQPRLNEDINEEWLSDKGRFQYDALKRQRLTVPLVKNSEGNLESKSWPEAVAAVSEKLGALKGNEIRGIAGKLADAESMIALKDLLNALGSGNTVHEAGFRDLDADARSNYIANTTIMGLESADFILIVGANPRVEAPVFNARIRKCWLDGVEVGMLGPQVDLTYPYTHFGGDSAALDHAAAGGGGEDGVLAKLKAAKRPAILVGPGVLQRTDRNTVLQKVHKLVEAGQVVREDWNGYNVLHDTASRVAALDIGFLPSASATEAPPPKAVWLLGADDFDEADVPSDAFVIYQGHHGDRGANRADVILPGAAYTEKSGTYVNFEGRPQITRRAVPVPGDARDDWKIIRAVSEVMGKPLPYSKLQEVRSRLADVAPHLADLDHVQHPMWLNGKYFKAFAARAASGTADGGAFKSSIANYYQTDAISRASSAMAKCTVTHADRIAAQAQA